MSSLKLFVCVFCFFFFASKATSKVSTSVSTPINRSTTLADLKTKIQQLLRFPAFQCKRPHHKLDMCKLYNQYEYVYIFTHHIDSSETPVSAFHPGGLFAKTFPKAPSAEKRMVKEHRIDGRKLRGGQAFGDATRCDKPPIIGPCLDRVHPPYCLPAFQGEPFPSTHILMVVNLRMPWTPP